MMLNLLFDTEGLRVYANPHLKKDVSPLLLFDLFTAHLVDVTSTNWVRHWLHEELSRRSIGFIFFQQIFGLDPRVGYPATIELNAVRSLLADVMNELADICGKPVILAHGGSSLLVPHVFSTQQSSKWIFINPQPQVSPAEWFAESWFSGFPTQHLDDMLKQNHDIELLSLTEEDKLAPWKGLNKIISFITPPK